MQVKVITCINIIIIIASVYCAYNAAAIALVHVRGVYALESSSYAWVLFMQIMHVKRWLYKFVPHEFLRYNA